MTYGFGTSRHAAVCRPTLFLGNKRSRVSEASGQLLTHFRPVGQFEEQLPCVPHFRACRSSDHFPSDLPLEGTRHEWWTNIHG
jgi:hypothetical protein